MTLALWDEAMDAINLSRLTDDDNEAAYLRGVNLGYLAALSEAAVWQTPLREARDEWFARALPYEQVKPLLGMLPLAPHRLTRKFLASGVLYGFHQATARRPDASECSACGGRVLFLTDDNLRTCAYHGTFCDQDCADLVCHPVCQRNDEQHDGPPAWWVREQEGDTL